MSNENWTVIPSQLFAAIYSFRHSSHFKEFLIDFHSRLISHFIKDETRHSDSDDAMSPNCVQYTSRSPSAPADTPCGQTFNTAVTMSCINALLLLETSNYASTANLRSIVTVHIVVSSKQQSKTVTWLPLVLPIVTCTCFLSQPWTVTTAKTANAGFSV
jgi:hypothetical protein